MLLWVVSPGAGALRSIRRRPGKMKKNMTAFTRLRICSRVSSLKPLSGK